MEYGSPLFIIWSIYQVVAVIVATVLAYIALYRVGVFSGFMDVAFASRPSQRMGADHIGFYHPQRLWRILTFFAALWGYGIIFYAIFIHLLGWMPYEWRDEDGAWIVESPVRIVAIISAVAFYGLLVGMSLRVVRHQALERYRVASASYERILGSLLSCPAHAVDFWSGYGERYVRYQRRARILDQDASDKRIKIIQAIKIYRQEGNGRRTCENVRNLPGAADRAEEASQRALDLIAFIQRERNGLELECDGAVLLELAGQSPDNRIAPGFHVLQGACNDSYTGGTVAQPLYMHMVERLIENVLWADQCGTIEQVDAYLRSSACWRLALDFKAGV